LKQQPTQKDERPFFEQVELLRDDDTVNDRFVQIGLKSGDNTLENGEYNGNDHPILLEFGQGQDPFEKDPLRCGFFFGVVAHEIPVKITGKGLRISVKWVFWA
jgi:hypothetical protein